MKTVLGLDIGYGDVKVIYGTSDGQILKQFKFKSMIGITSKNPNIKDNRIFTYKITEVDEQGNKKLSERDFYIGKDASVLPSKNIVDITDYKNLEFYAPLFLYYAIKQIDTKPDIIVTGLSKAQINSSGYFKSKLLDFTVNEEHLTFDSNSVFVLPQGAGSKKAIDMYGDNFPNKQTEFSGDSTYVGVDIGFNTLDMFQVADGKTSPNLFEGIEHEGVMKIARQIQTKVKELHQRDITLHEAKDILDTGIYKLRGQKFDFSDLIKEVKKQYLEGLLNLIDTRYQDILDKCDFIYLSGGGSSFFKSSEFNGIKIRVPKSNYEFYNAIGFYLFGVLKA